jgi:hypothetical protein
MLAQAGAAILPPVFVRDWSERPLVAKLAWFAVCGVLAVLVIMVIVAAIG